MKISSPDEPKVDEILKNEDEIKVATFMSKILTKALINRTQKFLKAKLVDQFSTPQFSGEMMTQISKIAAAETALTGAKEKSPSVPPMTRGTTPVVAPVTAPKPTETKEYTTVSAGEGTETKKKRTPITAPESVCMML